MKFTHFKYILALPTYGLTCSGFEWWAVKKWKMEPGHPVNSSLVKLAGLDVKHCMYYLSRFCSKISVKSIFATKLCFLKLVWQNIFHVHSITVLYSVEKRENHSHRKKIREINSLYIQHTLLPRNFRNFHTVTIHKDDFTEFFSSIKINSLFDKLLLFVLF